MMSAICLILIGLMAPATSNYVEPIPRVISFVVTKDGDMTRSILLRNRGDEPVILEISYKPSDIDIDLLSGLRANETVTLPVTLRIPEGTWAEAEEMRATLGDKIKKRKRFPVMTMLSKLGFVVRSSTGSECDTVEIPLRLRYDFDGEPVVADEKTYLEERPY